MFNFPSSVLPAFPCLLHKRAVVGAFSCGGAMQGLGRICDEFLTRGNKYWGGRDTAWLVFPSRVSGPLPPWALALVSYMLIHSVCVSEMHTDTHTRYEHNHLPGNKTFQGLFPPFLRFMSFIILLPSYAHIFSHFICKSTPSSVGHSSFGIRIALRIRWQISQTWHFFEEWRTVYRGTVGLCHYLIISTVSASRLVLEHREGFSLCSASSHALGLPPNREIWEEKKAVQLVLSMVYYIQSFLESYDVNMITFSTDEDTTAQDRTAKATEPEYSRVSKGMIIPLQFFYLFLTKLL